MEEPKKYTAFDPHIRPGDPGWIPVAELDCCQSQAPEPPGLHCTRDPGHEGCHAAHGDALYAVWPQKRTEEGEAP